MRKVLVFIIFFFPLGVFAQSYDEGLSHHQLGAEGSTLTGDGLTYSYIFDSVYRIKTTLWAYYQDNGGGSSNWTGSVGLELQRTFITTENTRFYGLVGGFYFSHGNKNNSLYYVPDSSNFASPYISTSLEHDFAAGFGVGFEVMVWKHVAINLAVSFEYAGVTYNNPYSGNPSKYVGPGIGGGVSYRF